MNNDRNKNTESINNLSDFKGVILLSGNSRYFIFAILCAKLLNFSKIIHNNK